jgi:hypothetical protein
MLHARIIGESFGLSCAEFSLKNKPILTWNGSYERNHIDTLGDKAILYNNKSELLEFLLNLNKNQFMYENWNCYEDYTPEKVIEQFKKTYL